jgi:GH15 family glucan-1,4-alpha-glucosidase
VYALDRSVPLPEKEHLNWTGYFGTRPVRSQNQSAEHVQNDIYGEMILAVAPIFLDERFQALCGKEQDDLLEYLTRFSIRTLSQPDAGLWEIRNGWRVHSFSHLMSWAGIEKAKTIQEKGYLKHLDIDLLQAEKRAQGAVESAKIEGSIRNGPGDPSLDSALLLLPILHYPSRELNETTVLKIAEELKFIEGPEGFLYRYIRHDDFGSPKSTFVICSFWLVQALARLGRNQDAQRIMKNIMTSSNHLGLFSEHYLPSKKIQSGNFPQAYSHVGQILAASAVSPS